jgi:hypothetical protein
MGCFCFLVMGLRELIADLKEETSKREHFYEDTDIVQSRVIVPSAWDSVSGEVKVSDLGSGHREGEEARYHLLISALPELSRGDVSPNFLGAPKN